MAGGGNDQSHMYLNQHGWTNPYYSSFGPVAEYPIRPNTTVWPGEVQLLAQNIWLLVLNLETLLARQ